MQEDLVVAYLEGTAHVPDDFWALVLKYRQLKKVVDGSGGMYAKSVDDQMNKIYDALLVL